MDVNSSNINKSMNNVSVGIRPRVQIQHTNNLKSDIELYEVLNESVRENYFKTHNKLNDGIRTIQIKYNTYVCRFG